MKIEKFTKQKFGQYKLLLDDASSILIHEDLILKYELLLKREIDKNKITKILEENNNYLAYDTSIKYISNKMRSIYEMKEYLKKKGISSDTISDVVGKLISQGYLNDDIYSKAYINDKINLSSDGPYKIIKNLKSNFINEEYIFKNIFVFTDELQKNRIEKLISKQIKTNHNKGTYLLKQKILNYLVDLGYEKSLVIEILNNTDFNDSNLYKKEYNKLYKQLSKKYDGVELEYKIKQKLFQKGFTNNNE